MFKRTASANIGRLGGAKATLFKLYFAGSTNSQSSHSPSSYILCSDVFSVSVAFSPSSFFNPFVSSLVCTSLLRSKSSPQSLLYQQLDLLLLIRAAYYLQPCVSPDQIFRAAKCSLSGYFLLCQICRIGCRRLPDNYCIGYFYLCRKRFVTASRQSSDTSIANDAGKKEQ